MTMNASVETVTAVRNARFLISVAGLIRVKMVEAALTLLFCLKLVLILMDTNAIAYQTILAGTVKLRCTALLPATRHHVFIMADASMRLVALMPICISLT